MHTRRLWDRMRQQRLLAGLPGLREQGAAVAVGRGDEASGHVVAEEGDGCRMAAVGHGQRAAGVGGVLRIGERRLCAEGDVRQIDAVPRESLDGPGSTLPPSGTTGSKISTLLSAAARALKFADVYVPSMSIAATSDVVCVDASSSRSPMVTGCRCSESSSPWVLVLSGSLARFRRSAALA
jgi:hypothetical protein